MNNKEAALSYLRKGYSVITLYSASMLKRKPPKKFQKTMQEKLAENAAKGNPLSDKDIIAEMVTRKCKTPCLFEWKEFQYRLPTEEEVSSWFDENPDASIGILTGKISNLVVFDLDGQGAIDYATKEGGFPSTAKALTKKGFHVYVQHPGFEVVNDVNKELGLDIRGEGGYVVAPPSIHASGHQYVWEDGCSIFDVDPAPCKPWMIEYLKEVASRNGQPKKAKEPAIKTKENPSAVRTADGGDEYAAILQNGATEGNRNHTVTKLVGHLLGKGIPAAEAWELVRIWNLSKNTPPLGEDELRRTFDSIKKSQELKAKTEKEIEVVQFLDTADKVIADYDQQYVKVPFGGSLLSNMEAKMNGGLLGGRLNIIGGIPSSCKTVLSNNMADNICLNGHPVLFFSYDDGRAEIRYRTYARFSGFEIEDFNNQRLSKCDLEAICKNSSVSSINGNKYIVQEVFKIEEWPMLIEKIHKRHQKTPVIMVDYLRKIKTENHRGDERLRVDEILFNLTNMAKAHNMPILVISELARDSYKAGQRLSMASFKESGSIEYEASWLGILAAVEEDANGYSLKSDWERIIEHDGNIDLIVFKAKRGTGTTGRIPLKLDKAKMTVRDRIESSKIDSVSAMKKVSKYD
jgi:replicative DNA helicase